LHQLGEENSELRHSVLLYCCLETKWQRNWKRITEYWVRSWRTCRKMF